MGQSEELTFGIQILEFITHDKNIKIYPDVYVEEWQVLKWSSTLLYSLCEISIAANVPDAEHLQDVVNR